MDKNMDLLKEWTTKRRELKDMREKFITLQQQIKELGDRLEQISDTASESDN